MTARAWIVYPADMPEVVGIAVATSRDRARYSAFLCARDVGFTYTGPHEFRARRAPSLDEWANGRGDVMPGTVWAPDYVPGAHAAITAAGVGR